jgi:hypothetical protein
VLQALDTLTVSSNALTALPFALGRVTSLGTLRAAHNQLACLPLSLVALTALTDLDLAGNALTDPPPRVVRCLARSGGGLTRQTAGGGPRGGAGARAAAAERHRPAAAPAPGAARSRRGRYASAFAQGPCCNAVDVQARRSCCGHCAATPAR